MCDVCNIENYINSDDHLGYSDYYGFGDFDKQYLLSDGYYTFLFMLYNTQTNEFGIKASGDDETIMYVNYCPKCGRKL